jgi:hypothetical protein
MAQQLRQQQASPGLGQLLSGCMLTWHMACKSCWKLMST